MDAPSPLVTLAIAAWGAALATLLALRDTWRRRLHVDATLLYRSDPNRGNEVLITNLSDRPITLAYWEVLFLNRRWPTQERARPAIDPEDDLWSRLLPPGDSCRLNFEDFNHFDLTSPLIYIKLHFSGRRPRLCRLWPR